MMAIKDILSSIKDLASFKAILKKEVDSMRVELDDHLTAINENTNELQSNYEYLCELDKKIEKLSQRLEEIQLHVSTFLPHKDYEIAPLTKPEKDLFVVLYGSEKPLSYDELAANLSISENLAKSYVNILIEKGIPIILRFINSEPFVLLDPQFKELQAKNELIKLK